MLYSGGNSDDDVVVDPLAVALGQLIAPLAVLLAAIN